MTISTDYEQYPRAVAETLVTPEAAVPLVYAT
jgi:hypothetical protein